MVIENPQEQFCQMALQKAKQEDSWFEIAAMRPFYNFELSEAEEKKVGQSAQVLNHLTALFNIPVFADHQITVDKAVAYIKNARLELSKAQNSENKQDLEKVELAIIALSNIFGLVTENYGVGNVLQNLADNDDLSKSTIDSYIKKIENSFLPEIYQKGLAFIESKKRS